MWRAGDRTIPGMHLPLPAALPRPVLRADLREPTVGLLALLTTFSLWGMVVIAPSLAVDVPPTLLAGSRYLLHGVASLALLRTTRGAHDPTLWRRAALHACTGFVGYYALVTVAVRTGGPTLVVLALAVSPVVYLLAGRPQVRARRLVLPVAAIVAGGVLATTGDTATVPGLGRGTATVVLIGAAIALWTWYGHDNARLVASPDVDLTRWTAMTGVAAGLLSLPLVAFGMAQLAPSATLLTPTNLGVVAALGLGCTTVANRTWNAASRRLRPTTIGPLLVVETVIALGYVHLLDGRVPNGRTLLGELLLVAGAAACLLALRPARRRAAAGRG